MVLSIRIIKFAFFDYWKSNYDVSQEIYFICPAFVCNLYRIVLFIV